MSTRNHTKRRVSLITEEIFNEVKQLAHYKIPNKQIAEITKLGNSTVSRIKHCDDYTLYKAHIHDLKMRAKKVTKKAGIKGLDGIDGLQGGIPPMDVQERIACALERLANAWEAQPRAKTGLFR